MVYNMEIAIRGKMKEMELKGKGGSYPGLNAATKLKLFHLLRMMPQ